MTWHGLLYSYFEFNPTITEDEVTHNGWRALRSFLAQTWPLIDRETGNTLVPDWIQVLRNEPDVLTAKPVEKYASAYLRGDTAATDRLSADLGIPPSSWFWHALVLGTVKLAASNRDDEQFRRQIPLLLRLVDSKPAFRDEALEVILIRYHACAGARQDEQLRDYVCQPTVWKNPKLRAAGIATAWTRVPDSVWHMVLSWVNERNLKDFFDILAARNKADEGRLAFWSKYLKQITWTRLVFGADTMALKRTNLEIRDLIAREEGAYAQLTGKREVDAFMMQIGAYLIIEFSRKPNACYVYKSDAVPFDRHGKYYIGGTDDLGAGFHQRCAARIVHTPGWEKRAAIELGSLGIRPDRAGAQQVLSTGGTQAASGQSRWTSAPTNQSDVGQRAPNMLALKALMAQFPGASIEDLRNGSGGGRLWVKDSLHRTLLATELSVMGFKWADRRQAWYFPEA
ncbi:EH_Signature domain-containing protein [Paraburkholderia caballeronis]|uniref:EH_Signature domain-containing protein n=1 Tax=Paraburkholderia caballeronis TaxID=416943 RepID=A0A1H7SGJ1_9BURK|nr:EH signature protein [Paraburkholderia caballeronis]PXW95964.1 EH signature protein [Paraburkholderia caballeronis]RAJ92330.1 EH signature protein [Paraburkholderia caballeronis]SEL71821.1 EH_Signature domain-containing protein [Paraburkholderia caballeronis]